MMQANELTQEALNHAVRISTQSTKDTERALKISDGHASAAKQSAAASEKFADAALKSAAGATEANRIADLVMKQTARILADENRAWVAIKNSRLEPLVAGQRPTAWASVFNSGKTPAFRVIARGGCGYGLIYSQDRLPPLGGPVETAVIVPNVEVFLPCLTKEAIERNGIDGVQNGTVPFIFAGIVTYTDRFGGDLHFTKYCFFFDHETKALGFCTAPGSNEAK